MCHKNKICPVLSYYIVLSFIYVHLWLYEKICTVTQSQIQHHNNANFHLNNIWAVEFFKDSLLFLTIGYSKYKLLHCHKVMVIIICFFETVYLPFFILEWTYCYKQNL